ncbi:hypothetical protein J7I93_08260 [Bacillus sp. ISL-47]|uniref:hypothetical protein n=1 Tax=Bacillus sp. ISL-47 TaxID=2819130 RepID=UPI001BE77F09|nr:hypothetical protein [Bacillus sp. ISL-47]MBT2688173.1 hypothetical protein [Bacillus sp. ISL-47]MBT2708459.1 hypothetical protein [Pseudomonas sp. ISL-84]
MALFDFKKRKDKYEHYVNKAFKYDKPASRDIAIAIMQEAVLKPFPIKEIASGYFYLGILYEEQQSLEMAAAHYEKAFQLVADEDIPYDSGFKRAIVTFIKIGDQEKAEYWLNHLLARSKHNRKFKKLEKIKTELLL